MFLGILNAIFLNISYNLFDHESRVGSIQIVILASFVIISNVGIKTVDCTLFLQAFQELVSEIYNE